MSMIDQEPVVAKSRAERRRFRRVAVNLPGRMFVPGDGREARCEVIDLSPGGASIRCEINPEQATPIVLYIDGFGRFEGNVARKDGFSFGVAFVCTPSKRERTAEQLTLFMNKALVDDSVLRRHERTAEQLTLFMNKALVDDSVLRRHERTGQKGFAKFTRADGQIVHCEVLDISVGGCALKCDVRPAIGEFVLIAQIAGRVARHHEQGIGIEFVGQDKAVQTEVAHRLNLVK